MTTSEANPAPTAAPTATPTLADGPIKAALAQVAAAEASVEDARAAVRSRRDEFATALRARVAAQLEANGGTPGEEIAELVRSLYWDHPNVRVGDIAAALGCSQRDVREIAGTRLVHVPCPGCGVAMELEQSSRSNTPWANCESCLAEWARRDEADLAHRDLVMPADEGHEPRYAEVVTHLPADPHVLRRLIDHLRLTSRLEGCDDRFTRTRAYAQVQHLDVELLVAQLQSRGAYCDCDVLRVLWF